MSTGLMAIMVLVGLWPAEPTVVPNHEKRLAKAELAKPYQDLSILLQARLGSAHDEYQARLNEFKNGRGTQRFLLNAAARLLDAQHAVARDRIERMRELQEYWLAMWCIEQTNRARFQSGRISSKEYAEVTDLRLQAEMDLRDARRDLGDERSLVVLTPDRLSFLSGEPDSVKEMLFFSKTFSRASHTAQRSDPKELARHRVAAAGEAFRAREREFLAGRGTLHFLNEALARNIEAQLAAAENDAERVAIYEAHWMISKQNEQNVKDQFDNGRVALHDPMDARHTRLEVESAFLRARAQSGTRKSSALARTNEFNQLEEDDPRGFRELAKAEREALHKNPGARRAEMLQTSQAEYRQREGEFLAGRGTLSFLIDSAVRLVDAELALTDKPAKRLAVLKENWRRFQRMEEVNRQRHSEDRIAAHDLDQTIYWRLDAEIRLARAQSDAATK